MGAKPSKSSDDRILRSFISNENNNNKKNQLRDVLRRRKPKKAIEKQKDLTTPSNCTTEHECTTIKNNNDDDDIIPTISSSIKRASPNAPYDISKSKKSRRNTNLSLLNHNANSKHVSLITTTSSDIRIYSNISSACWTALSNDPFSQIEANTSTFTEITDHSTISRKSLYQITENPSYHPHTASPITAQNIHITLNSYPNHSHSILKEAFQRIQQKNDPLEASHFFIALNQQYPTTQNSNIIVYLAKCHLLGLGTAKDIERGLQLLQSNPSCESFYALGIYYLDETINKTTAFEYFKKACEYDITNDSILMTVSEAQCTLARMLFQGEGTRQNSQDALNYLLASARNENMYAQFLIGVHYERGIELEKDLEKAKEYYRQSADKGFPDAQAALGTRLIAESNYSQGIQWLEKAIEMGNSRAHVQLGILYDKGEGVAQNYDTALFHYKTAAEKKNSSAQYILGLVYYFGRLGQQRNHKEAIRLMKQAALAGLPYAQRVLGQLYQQGNVSSSSTPKKNEREAIRWFKRAAAGADVIALNLLGKCYEAGTGVELDLEKALAFYAKAAQQVDSPYVCHAQIDQARLLQKMARHVEAFCIYSLVLKIGDPLRDKLPMQTAKSSVARYHLCRDIDGIQYDPVLAHTMLSELVETTNDPLSHYWLGSIYDEGIPGLFNIDRQKAFRHFLIAAEAGDNDATFLVAYMMSNNVVPDKGPSDAFPWYQKAAMKGHPMSTYSLGLCYYKGISQDAPDLNLALEWFEKAMRLGVSEAVSYVARVHLKLMIIHANQPDLAQQHFIKAVQALKDAVDKGDTYAERELGKIYLTGKGVTANYSAAVDLLQKAAAKDDAEAITFLGDCYHKGVGVDKNTETAAEHYLRAATLGYPYAYSAAAELYYEIGNMDLAYDYYLLASKESRIANNDVGKTARMMVARLALGDIPLKPAQTLIDSKKTITPEIAFETLSTLAIQDKFPQAFQPLGCCYLRGTGTSVNPVQAIFWLRKSAEEHNDSIAYFYLADLYGNGLQDYVEVDIPLALDYLNKSAQSGYAEAQYRMGMIYFHGEYGVRKDDRTAATWFKRAASESHVESIWMLSQLAGLINQSELELQYQKNAAALGHVVAMRVLGEKYLKQLEIPFLSVLMQQEYLDEALKYLHMAGDANDTEALVILGKTYNSCIKTKLKFSSVSDQALPTPSNTYTSGSFCDDEDEEDSRFQCEEDEKNLAIMCFEKASQLGDINGTVYAAEAWYEQKQYAAALELFQKAASQGSVLARFFCARYCIEGYGGSPLDPERGFKELLICANELNCVHAYNTLGQCYENGIGTTKDDRLAFEWYIRAAEITHDSDAYYRIALMYAQERIPTDGTHKDLEACKYFDLAVNTSPDNHGLSCYQLGMYYLKGIPGQDKRVSYLLPPDASLAMEYFRTAADLNVTEAMLQLGILLLAEDCSLEEQEEGVVQLQRAAELGLREAQFELGLLYHRGKEVILTDDIEGQDMDEEECIIVPQDFEKAYDLFCRSAVQRHPTATYYLGMYHQHGIFVAPDLAIALEQYEIAVELYEKYETAPDRWQAEFNLAHILHHDMESRSHAYELFQAAHLHAPTEFKFLSKIMITKYHLYGWGNVTVKAEEAASTLIAFAQEESFGYRVYLEVAQCFENGIGVEKNLRQAFHWYSEVINKAHLIDQQQEFSPLMFLDEEIEEDEALAMFKLAEFYRQGLVVERDTKKADDLYQLAAKKGSQAAQEFLSLMLQKTKLHD